MLRWDRATIANAESTQYIKQHSRLGALTRASIVIQINIYRLLIRHYALMAAETFAVMMDKFPKPSSRRR